MDRTSLTQCIELVELDRRITQSTQELAESSQVEVQLQQEMAQIGQDVASAKQSVHDAQKAVDALELEIKVLDQKSSRTQEKFLTASSQKEFDSLEIEKKDIQVKKAALDEQGLVLLEVLENAQLSAAKIDTELPEKERAKQKEIDDHIGRREHLSKLLGAYEQERNELLRLVPEEFVVQYDLMKKRVPNPVVPIINDGCSGCFHGLSKPEIIKAEAGSLIHCQGCYRMLYIFKAVQEDTHDEQQSV